MNEAPFPTQTTVPHSLPPPTTRGASTARVSLLRNSLQACSGEGLVAEVVGVCFGSTVVTAWGIELGASPLLLSVLWGLPYFGQAFQLPGAWVTSRFGRKRVAVAMNALARQALLPAAALPFVDLAVDAKRAVLVVLFALASLLSILGNNAWLAWMGDLVPARVRGRYFGRRTAMCTVAATIASLGVAWALDAGRAHRSFGAVLTALIVARSVLGFVTTMLMLRQHDPPGAPPAPELRDLTAPIVDRAYRGLLVYRAAWGTATGLTASLSALYLLQSLGLGFVGLAAYAAAVSALRVVTTPLWGRMLDRAGGRPVLVACSFGAAASSFLWVGATSGYIWMIAVDAVLSGMLLGGQELAVFTLPLAVAPSARRPLFVATNMMVGGLAYGLACISGGALAASFSVRTLLLLSAVARALAAATALRLEPRVPSSPRLPLDSQGPFARATRSS
jgi:MFS family permease